MNDTRPQAVNAQNVTYEVEGSTLLNGVDLCADRGQMVGLIGPNGAESQHSSGPYPAS